MLTFRFDGADGKMFGSDVLTTGMSGQVVRLEFSQEWDAMAKTAVFTAGEVSRDVLVDSNLVTIPAEVLQVPMVQLFVGVYGVAGDGRVIPAVQVAGPYICPGSDPTGDLSVDPALPVWAQLQLRLETLEDGILDVDLTGLNLHYEESGTWIYPLSNTAELRTTLDAVKEGRRIRLNFLRKGSTQTVVLDSCRVAQNTAVCSGIFVEAPSGADAVRGIITLEIFSSGNGVLVSCMNPAQGFSREQADQILANREAIESLPVSVSDDGYTQITGQRRPVSIRMVRDGDTVTVTTTFQGDVIHGDVITLDGNGFPAGLVSGGVACDLEFAGFEEDGNGI